MTVWTQEMMESIHAMLNPKSLAIIGATPRQQYGGRMLKAVLRVQHQVNVYAVNPKYNEILGVKSYKSISDLPEAPDVVAVVVPYHQVLSTLKDAHAKGVKAGIVISAGFAERGMEDRALLQDEISQFSRESGLRISGPNCLGLANIKDDIWLTSSSHQSAGVHGKVGLICQSGATLFGPFLARAVDSGIGLSYLISTGNEADLDFSDFARYLLDDPNTSVIAGFVEGFKDARKFIEVAKIAAERGKPIVLIKIGRSELGQKAANSHTAALTGSDALYDAICRQYGVIRVSSYDDLLEVSQLMVQSTKPEQSGIAVVSHSGGICSLTADMCGQHQLDLPALTDHALTEINDVLKGFGWAANPADVTGMANSDSFPRILNAMIDEPLVGALVIASSGGDQQIEQICQLRQQSTKNMVYLWTGSRKDSPSLQRLKESGVPVFYSPDSMACGLKSMIDYYAWLEQYLVNATPVVPVLSEQQKCVLLALKKLNRANLSEYESKQLIAAWHVNLTGNHLVSSVESAVKYAKVIGYPVVLKVDSPDIPHKTEAGIVALNLDTPNQVREAYARITENARLYAPNALLNGVILQEMVKDGIEVIVGIHYDAQIGPILLFGIGGIMVELYKDVVMRQCPINLSIAHEMISEIKGAQLLKGFRGMGASDIQALANVLVDISYLGLSLEGDIVELDINPLLVLADGKGVRALDALVKLKEK